MTATRQALLDLAARVEAAGGPSHDLDIAIFRVLHPEYAGPEWQSYGGGLRHRNDGSDARCLPPPERTPSRWTASLDAALSLVPEGWRWSVDFTQRAPYRDCGRVDLYAPGDGLTPPDVSDVYAATPALALCAAALRARAEEVGNG